jgi:hypothetical protein
VTERLSPCIAVFAEKFAAGVYVSNADGAKRRLLPPAPGACTVIHEGEWSDSIGSILNASLNRRIEWPLAVSASQHVGLFRLPESVQPAGSSLAFEIKGVLGWERAQWLGAEPGVLNLLVDAVTTYHNQFTGEAMVEPNKLQLLLAPSAPLKRIDRAELLEHATRLEEAFSGFDG